ncbi:MAG: tyrosine-type recombinase/integrase [Planctomycetia bacterium]|nr:tyrosine-type recombinase/integrase [Planctomycetia bacterium]
MANSTSRKSAAKSPRRKTIPTTSPARKPRFPLWQHAATGQWCKKIGGRKFYFGTDKDAALAEYLRVKDDLEAGRPPAPKDDERLTIKTLANVFLTHKKSQVEIGELTQASFNDYLPTCEGLASGFGKHTAVESIRPDDLLKYRRKLAETNGPTSLGNEVTRCRVLFNFAFANGLIDKPVRYGEFKSPKKSASRRLRASKGSKLFEAAELRQIIDAADIQLRAMILLGINCGFGNADCGTLPIDVVDLCGWIDYPRPKTGIARRCPLWPETVAALREWLPNRKQPTDAANSGLLFVTKYGAPWHVDGATGNPISAEFRKLLNKLELYREGLSFYALRHTFQTIGDEAGDYLAVRRIMGHADNSISDHYRERFSDDRLVKVTEHVRRWLQGKAVPQ